MFFEEGSLLSQWTVELHLCLSLARPHILSPTIMQYLVWMLKSHQEFTSHCKIRNEYCYMVETCEISELVLFYQKKNALDT